MLPSSIVFFLSAKLAGPIERRAGLGVLPWRKGAFRLHAVFCPPRVRSLLIYVPTIQSELEVELLWGQLDRREKELNMSKIGAR